MPGKPAARLTDMTAHGGMITGPGVPTVLIGKMPAATLGDMHMCPMVTPAVPPIPHVGGPITLGSTGVFIGKKPAARLGDMAICVGPPSSIILGCFTVMIGEAGSGSQAGSAGAAAAASTMAPTGVKKVEAIKIPKKEVTPKEAYQILAQLKDKGGRPLSGVRYKVEDPDGAILKGATSADGMVVHSGYTKKGSYKIAILDLSYDITVKDHKGQVMANQEIEIDQPDGQVHKVKTDGSGKVKVKTGTGARSAFTSHIVEKET
jgi:uncharacterized Zn-binding protein involved in type VI secretion